MIPIHTQSAWRGTSDCRSCAVREVALFSNLNEEDFAVSEASRPLLPGRGEQVSMCPYARQWTYP